MRTDNTEQQQGMTNAPSLEHVNWNDIPQPEDDGAADHLTGKKLPHVSMPATDGQIVNIGDISGLAVIYIYPMTGRPDTPPPEGWDMIPGARGCTPQSCTFRDHFAALKGLGVRHLFGLSTQSTDYQREACERLHLPFPLLSDEKLLLANALSLPAMTVAGKTLLKRLTMVIENGSIIFVRYPVFPPYSDAANVMGWLGKR